MTTLIYVSAYRIGRAVQGAPAGDPITVEQDGIERYARAVRIDGPSVVRYTPDAPHPSGSRCWVETDSDIEILSE